MAEQNFKQKMHIKRQKQEKKDAQRRKREVEEKGQVK